MTPHSIGLKVGSPWLLQGESSLAKHTLHFTEQGADLLWFLCDTASSTARLSHPFLPHSNGPTPSRPACLPPKGTAEQGPRAARSYRAAPAPQPPRSDPASEKDGSAQRRSPPPHRSRGPRPSSVGAAATTSSKVAGRGRPQGRPPAGPSSPPLPSPPSAALTHPGVHGAHGGAGWRALGGGRRGNPALKAAAPGRP